VYHHLKVYSTSKREQAQFAFHFDDHPLLSSRFGRQRMGKRWMSLLGDLRMAFGVLLAALTVGLFGYVVLRVVTDIAASMAWRFRQLGEWFATTKAAHSDHTAPVEDLPYKGSISQYSESVVRIYGQFLENMSCGPLEVRDESELPYPKWRIASDLLAAISAAPTPETKSALSISLISLATFQPRIGAPLRAPTPAVVNQAKVNEEPMSDGDAAAAEIAAAAAASTDTRRYESARHFANLEEQWFAQLALAHSGS
jgi:hypothetical protein